MTDAPATPGPRTRSREPDSGLHARLDSPLPEELAVGAGTALFVCGSCFHPRAEIRSLRLVLDGEPRPLMAERMPRLDVFRALHPTLDPLETSGLTGDPDSDDDPQLRGYRSGFWGIVEIEPTHADRAVALGLRATLEDGTSADAELGRIGLRSELRRTSPGEPAGSVSEKLVAICMATYNPPSELFERQIESIRRQTHRNWVCVISDDCSSPEGVAAMEAIIGDDPRFVFSPSTERLGFYANFERALAMAPADAPYAAMADQDDRWAPEKLEVLLEAIGDAGLVYSDARIVDRGGELISDTYWSRRRNNYTDLASLLIANTVTGAASLFRREVLELALPFPPRHGRPYHDHWVACVALATGRIAYVDRPLYDYVQHHEAALGHARANAGPPVRSVVARTRRVTGDPRSIVARWRATYFWDVCRIVLFARILERRFDERMSSAKRRAVRRVVTGERSALAIPWLLLRRSRTLAGRNETLGVETGLLRGIVWRHAVTFLAGRSGRPGRRFRFSASLPSRSSLSTGPPITHQATRTLADKTRPLDVSVRPGAPSRVNLLIPKIDLRHFFGGYIAKLNLARRLADLGLRVRLVTVDETHPLPPSWRRTVESYEGLDGLFDRIEVAFAREQAPLELSPTDRFIATTWWTAHLAHIASKDIGRNRFVYLIQEGEQFTFPMGAFAALAQQSYGFSHFAVFSTELLRDYFRRHQLGVYSEGVESGDRYSLSFENAITPIEPPTDAELAGRSSRRLLLYARPEAHAARNMFELAILALAKAVSDGVIGGEWELHGVGGTGQGEPPIELGDGRLLELLPRSPQGDYADLLRGHDVGLALMYTPHPSLVPIEMASAGMVTVTNSFENKTPEAMAAISKNLITVEPSLDGIVQGLREAVAGVGDATSRAEGARVRWSRDWDTSFDEEIIRRIAAFLESC